MGIRCFAISIITDEGWHEDLKPVKIEQVIEVANKTEPKMAVIFKELMKML
jgi:purine-nucleoside phosphorylase